MSESASKADLLELALGKAGIRTKLWVLLICLVSSVTPHRCHRREVDRHGLPVVK